MSTGSSRAIHWRGVVSPSKIARKKVCILIVLAVHVTTSDDYFMVWPFLLLLSIISHNSIYKSHEFRCDTRLHCWSEMIPEATNGCIFIRWSLSVHKTSWCTVWQRCMRSSPGVFTMWKQYRDLSYIITEQLWTKRYGLIRWQLTATSHHLAKLAANYLVTIYHCLMAHSYALWILGIISLTFKVG